MLQLNFQGTYSSVPSMSANWLMQTYSWPHPGTTYLVRGPRLVSLEGEDGDKPTIKADKEDAKSGSLGAAGGSH